MNVKMLSLLALVGANVQAAYPEKLVKNYEKLIHRAQRNLKRNYKGILSSTAQAIRNVSDDISNINLTKTVKLGAIALGTSALFEGTTKSETYVYASGEATRQDSTAFSFNVANYPTIRNAVLGVFALKGINKVLRSLANIKDAPTEIKTTTIEIVA